MKVVKNMNRFKITKIGLLNFWLYDEEEYDFYGGNLILRGSNGSGKSVTMQSFIPLILDGNKSPDRLDPFGSKERKIEDYILGDSESVQKEESTAYLYMETLNEEENKYITIGLGFRGRKGKPTESWGFALKNGRRIGKDFFLYKDATNKIPLSKIELKTRLEGIDEFTDTTKDYKTMVNRLLFGFPNTDTYDEFIKLLLQLRSNKLSKDYKPTNLVNVLNTVLQPLTEEDLRALSEAIESMNQTKEKVETLEKNSKALNEFLKVYRNYNEALLSTKAKNYSEVSNDYKNLCSNLENLNKALDELKTALTDKEKRYTSVLDEIKVETENKRQLDNKDLKQKIESLNQINETIHNLEAKLEELATSIEKSEDEHIDFANKIKDVDNEIFKIKKDCEHICLELKNLSEDAYFNEIVFFADELIEKIDSPISFESINISLKRYSDKVNLLLSLLESEAKILEESESIRIEFERLSNEYKEIERDITSKENELKDSILKWEEDFVNITNNNTEFKIDDESKKQIFTLINDYSRPNYDKAKNVYDNLGREFISRITANILKLENKLNTYKIDLNEQKIEYDNLKNAPDIELPSLNEETDKVLQENNIESLPLYKCIEFKSSISEQIKNNIESCLLDLNILNAKIIKPSDIEKVRKLNIEILYLTKTTKKKNNILKYFEVKVEKDSKIDKNYIESILECISIDTNDIISIQENGISKIDVLNSIADSNYKQAYIGYLKRCELKNTKLKNLEEKMEITSKEISNVESMIKDEEKKIEAIKEESTRFPSNDQIESIIEKLKELNLHLSFNDTKQKAIEENLTKYNAKLKEIKNDLSENSHGIYAPLNLVSLKKVSSFILAIKDLLSELKNTHLMYTSKIEIKSNYNDRLEMIDDNLDYLRSEEKEKTSELLVNRASKESIEELLNTKEYANLKDRLLKIEENLNNLNNEKDDLLVKTSTYRNEIKNKEEILSNLSLEVAKKEKLTEVYREIFMREYSLKYIYEDDIIDLDKTVKNIIKESTIKKNANLRDILNDFYASFNRYSLELNDYSLKNVTLFQDYEGTDDELKKIYDDNTRQDITSMYQGVRLNIIKLAEKLKLDIEENKLLISTQDRVLFEDILLNTVGEKIRNRIHSSNEWVKKINNIMMEMQKDSALSFKLVWKSISAENEGEVDTKELVKILEMPPDALSDKDKESLTNHFRSKIKKAEELYEDSYISFYKIIESVLDYRTWFSFQLFYQRKGMNLKELTDKTFSKFSGGERAKSMYIPLFASCYAKLNLARPDALRIIALDEAFAGVDEDNIREMFGILKYLDLNFIINSQVLWGDYDTVEDLSICELIRPQNSQVVTVERYRWNGKYKELITNRKEEADA